MAGIPQISSVMESSVDAKRHSAPRIRGVGSVPVPLLIVTCLLVALGLLVVHSAVSTNENYSFSRQLIGVGIGFVAMVLIWRFDYRLLSDMVFLLLVVNVVLILSPHFPIIGVEAKGAQSWIKIGIQLQPGEFAKVTVVLLAASVVARYGGRLDDPVEYVKSLGIMLIPFFCIMTQPDLGTGLVYIFITGIALVMGGADWRFIALTLLAAVVGVLLILGVDELLKYQTDDGTYEYKILKNYQRNRLTVFLDPEGDTSGSGYNLQQAQIAIGSGGFFGKGLGNGTQAALNFLPEAPTDFIFCVLAEELGFLGVLVLLALYGALILICFGIARGSGDLFGMLIVMCTVGMWLFQILENIGMTCGLMPITGIPLPFVSYGSSFMLVNFALLGLVGSVWSHNQPRGKVGENADTY